VNSAAEACLPERLTEIVTNDTAFPEQASLNIASCRLQKVDFEDGWGSTMDLVGNAARPL